MTRRPSRASAGAVVIGLALALLSPASPGVAEVGGPSGSTLGLRPASAASLGVGGAVSAVLVEASTGQVIVARDEHRRRPVASAIKLVTALVVVGSLASDALVVIGPEVEGLEGASYGLRPGEVRYVEDLLAGLLLRSGNDAAVALAVAVAGDEQAFVSRMSDVLGGLGIDARPGSASGLELDDALSAAELAKVAEAALREPRIRAIVGAPVLLLADGTEIENRNLFLSDTVGATGLKTGFTNAAGFTLAASAQRDGRELIAVVLGAEDDRARRSIAVRLLEHGFMSTRSVAVDRSVTLRTTGGPVRFTTAPMLVTLGRDAELSVRWPRGLRPDAPLSSVELGVDGSSAGSVEVLRLDGRRGDAQASLGRALADGVYAALRPVGLASEGDAVLR